MTQYWGINEDGGLDVWDHEGTQVGENEDWSDTWDEYPADMKGISRDAMSGNQPSAYNQKVMADYLFGDIERGNPNDAE